MSANARFDFCTILSKMANIDLTIVDLRFLSEFKIKKAITDNRSELMCKNFENVIEISAKYIDW